MMRLLNIVILMSVLSTASAINKQWTTADGLPTGEVHQIVELPNGQMLVNCEGVFCLSDGQGFRTVPCDYNRAYRLPRFSTGYSQQWQGDSLLWLRDYYRIYLFDARARVFRYDFAERMTDVLLERFKPSPTSITDRQGGIWTGTVQSGIVYTPPTGTATVEQIKGENPLIALARSTIDSKGRVWHCKADGLECEQQGETMRYNTANVTSLPYNRTSFITELPKGYLLCNSMNVLGYFYPERKVFVPLNKRLPVLNKYRYFVGACLLGKKWVAVYSQNGAFLLNIETNSLAPFPCAKEIEQNSSKYNCMVRDKKKRLWVGTQNGLYILMPTGRENDYVCERIAGLTNNCIRSLVVDAQDEVWAGTSCGICKIAEAAVPHHTFNVINFGAEDGFPTGGLMERAAILASDGRLVFVFRATAAVAFHPEQMVIETKPLDVVITAMNVAGKTLSLEALRHDLSLAYDHNNLTFQFSALNYASPSHTRYRYRLLGIEKDWQEGTDGSQGEVEYRALPPGQYNFEVQANIDGGKWGNTTTQTVTIRPPFWLTWWAKSIYCLLILMAITILINLYLSRKRKKMERENDQRVHRLFELREEARHQFAENTNIDPQKIGVNSEEETLAKRMLKAIEAHLSDTDYGVEQLAQDVGMSRSALYTKLRNMLGISPADFIRNVRLKRAAQLLSDTTLPISEIADRVGYNTHKAFVANFKKLFGMLPSEYREPKTS